MSILITNKPGSGSGGGTPPVGFSVNTSTTAASATQPIIFSVINTDSNSGYNSGTGRYTIPSGQAGLWNFSAGIFVGATATDVDLYLNGSKVYQGSNTIASTSVAVISTSFTVAVGDIVDIRPGASSTATGSNFLNYFSGFKVGATGSGTTLVGSVSGRYHATSGTLTASDSLITYTTKDFDTNNAYSSGILTIPITGKYTFMAKFISASGGTGTNNQISIYQNNVQVSSVASFLNGGSGNNKDVMIVDTISCTAGDTIKIEGNDNGTTPSLNSSNTRSVFTWVLSGT
jgi:hypothetical protein